MNDRQIRSFILTVERKSFTKAAADSFISTPALINQINLLERDTSLILFNRTPRGIEPTEEGKVFYKYAKQILGLYEEALEEAHNVPGGSKKIITVYGGDRNITTAFKQFCFSYMQEHEDIHIRFEDLPYDERVNAMQEQTDAILASQKMAPVYENGLTFLPSFMDGYSLLLPHGHILADGSQVLPEQLQGYHILCEKNTYDEIDLTSVFANVNNRLEFHNVYRDETTVLNAFTGGKIVLRPTRWCNFDSDIVVKVPLALPAQIDVGLYYHETCSNHVKEFLDEYRRYEKN